MRTVTEIVAVIDRTDRAPALVAVARDYAGALTARLTVHDLAHAGAAALQSAAASPADLLVVPADALEPEGWAAGLLPDCAAPLLAVPETAVGVGLGNPPRVLAPLDGTREAESAVVAVLDLFSGPGADVVVLHVFDEDTAPLFWDQPAHARDSWGEEFLTRHARRAGSRLELRSGSAREEVLDAARAEHADVIALGCSGHLAAGRARLVRHVLRHADVPVLLVHPGARAVHRPPAEAAAR